VLEVLRPQAFVGIYRDGGGQAWKTDYYVINSETGPQVIDTSHMSGRGALALDGQTRALTLFL
jgi:hypothetical protein